MMTTPTQLWFIFQAFFQGVLLFQALYMSFHYWALRRREYLYYAAYVGVKSLYFIIQSVEIYQYPDNFSVPSSFTFHYFKFLSVGGYLMYCFFISEFFNFSVKRDKAGIFLRKIRLFLGGYILLELLMLLVHVPEKIHNTIYALYCFLLFGLCFYLIVYILRTLRDLKSRFIAVGSLVFALGSIGGMVVVSVLKIQTYEWLRLVGILIELICFSIALALKNQEVELEKQRFQGKLAEAEISALRSQMNPHFIFNALSSINNFMLNNNNDQASLYLTKFSRLIRLVLENSRTEKVLLVNELAALEIYLEMEVLRFKEKLKYKIIIDPSVSKDFTEIPPLLLQPYVENAIWHGLMHKQEGGTVVVDIQQLGEHNLQISITDDGVGRARAEDLKSRSATRQKSYGMQITSERLNAINTIFKTQTRVSVLDLFDTEGVACGTKVNLAIPC